MRRLHLIITVVAMCVCLPVAADKPVSASLQVVGTKMSIQWQARAGVAYQVQGSNDRENWKNHGGIRVGPTANSAPIGRSYRYYRVIELKTSGSTKLPSKVNERRTPTEKGKTPSENIPPPQSLPENEASQKGKTLPKDFKSLKALAEKGDVRAQYNLGCMYNDGEEIEQSFKEALKWWRKAAEQGHAKAQNNLGRMYGTGRGVEQDFEEAVKWTRKAAEKGNDRAQFNLGVMYRKGEGVLEDDKEAARWCRKAAEQGDARAQFNLGVMYAGGIGVERSAKEALGWYRKAADQGFAAAQINLGLMYDIGEGVLEDNVTAYAWYNIAAANGGALAKQNKGIISREMTPELIAEAQRFSRLLIKKIEKTKAGEPKQLDFSFAPRIGAHTGLSAHNKLKSK